MSPRGRAVVESATRRAAQDPRDTDLFDGPDAPLVRVSALVGAVVRRRRVWMAAAAAGLLAALAFVALRAPGYSATTTMLLRRSSISPQDPARAMQTDVQLAESRTVAGRALNQLGLGGTIAQLQGDYSVASLTDDIVALTAKAPTAAQAVRRANTLAAAFLQFRAQDSQREAQVQIAALQQESNTLQAQVGPLDQQIDTATIEAGDSTSSPEANTLGDLLAQRAQVQDRIATVKQTIDNVTADSYAVVHNTQVVDPALPNQQSKVKGPALDLAVGLLGGLAMGMGWVVVAEAVSNRVRRREDVMVALGAPVLVSVGPLEAGRRVPRRSGSSSQARRDVAKVSRHLREVMATTQSPTPALALVSVQSDQAAARAAEATVRTWLSEGNDVLAIDLSGTAALARCFGVGANEVSQVQLAGGDAKLWLVSRSLTDGSDIDDWLQLHNLRDETDAVLVLATLDPSEGAAYLADLATIAVAVVTCGRSTVDTLRATSQMLRVAGLRLDSAVLVDTDQRDESFGGLASVAQAPPAWA
jgi:capsular polysaccharide biosynthesis protein